MKLALHLKSNVVPYFTVFVRSQYSHELGSRSMKALKRNQQQHRPKSRRQEAIPREIDCEKQKLKALFLEFEEVHDEYAEIAEDEADKYFKEVRKRYLQPMTESKVSKKENVKVPAQLASSSSVQSSSCANETALALLQLPKVEIELFDGSPLKYHAFSLIFEETVEAVVKDNQARLTKQAIEILQKRFGDEHIIVNAVVNSVREGGKANSAEEVCRLSDDLQNGVNIIMGMGRLSEIDSQRLILEIIDRLPNT
ncbi:hypothetical protein CAPTEDRAFT_196380 [Capitella teleta]|uniref:Uncharacterized protein n=1 Tax=Capitella teleta TaxID=283909 RepID=R7T778_CAPTE|nr:hypothetical protein CAPTEDRAFT_196380 [Capitella teleta]|eukprot:ELT89499.1 hypothetical protein CAPTEDRAFT_196380 [Capitella teleta]